MELLRIYQILDSTNKEAARLLASGEPLNGTSILAFQQTEGRGQYGREWHASPGEHLALSIIIKPSGMKASELPLMSMQVSLALIRSLLAFDPSLKPMIKWPNDIFVDNKKLAGILIENLLSSTKVQHCIIGIGMNVNETEFPTNIPNPTSLRLLTGKTFNIEHLAHSIMNAVIKGLVEPVDNWKKSYDEFIYGLGRKNTFELNDEPFTATINGVDMNGKIILEDNDGQSKSYFAHEIKWKL